MTITIPPLETSKAKANVAIIILAAGASTRMGKPKQLLPYQGCSLLQHTIESAINSLCNPVVVVLGANAQQITSEVKQPSVLLVNNPEWQLGMNSSIRYGILSLSNLSEKIDAAVIAVCDQPFFTAEIINGLVVAYHSTGKPIIASQYANTIGVPALFNQRFFPELIGLKKTSGAKILLKRYLNEVFCVPFPLGEIDLDTPRDYHNLLSKTYNNFPT